MGEQRETLAQWADRLRGMQTRRASAWFVLAKEVCALAERWADYSAEANGMNVTTWLKSTLGKPLSYYKARHEAVLSVDESARRFLDESALIWVAHKVPGEHKHAVLVACAKASRERCANLPLSLNVTQSIANRICNCSKTRQCKRCALIDEWATLAGVQIPKDLDAEITRLREERATVVLDAAE